MTGRDAEYADVRAGFRVLVLTSRFFRIHILVPVDGFRPARLSSTQGG
jgi:hypothetical protein